MSDPMLTRLAERFAQLSPAQRKKFYQKLQEQSQSWAQFPIVPAPVSADGGAPLSYAQLRQWFLWQLDRESSAYHLSSAMRWRGTLNEQALIRGFVQLANRHLQLKVRFAAAADGSVRQYVDEGCTPIVEQVDLGSLESEERTAHVQQLVQQWQQTPFDLEAGQLLRVGLIRLADDEHVLVVVVHHIVADDWSLQLLVEEFCQIYQAAVAGQEATLAPLSIQYTDYASWQRSWMEAGERDRQLGYWMERLQGERPVLELPSDNLRRTDGHYTMASQQRVISGALADGIRHLCVRERLTPFMVFLAAFQLMLARHTGLLDISVGIPVSNRNRPELEGLVGFFVNTQVMRTVMHESLSLQQLLAQVRQASIGAQSHQDLPFDQLVEALHPDRTPGVNPLFQVMFNYLTGDAEARQAPLPGVVLENHALGSQGAQFELVMNTVEAPDGSFHVGFSWAKELFRAETIERMFLHVQLLLDAMVQHPDMRIGNVQLLSAGERVAMHEWACNSHQHASLDLVLTSFARHVNAKPSDTALIFGGENLSYEVLDRRSTALAQQLCAKGVRPEERVGIFQERSLDLVISMLGVLKAGAAFVPLDPELPTQRIAYMMQDSGLHVVLTHEHLRAKLPVVAGVKHLLVEQAISAGIDADAENTVYAQNDETVSVNKKKASEMNADGRGGDACFSRTTVNDLPAIHGNQLAYVIYTSGSTGTPKGVGVSHRSLASCMQWMQREYALDVDDTVLHKAPIGFDVSCWEIFWPLTSGVRLAIAAPGDHRDPQRIFELIEQHRVTTMNFVPQMLQAFLDSRRGQPTGLRHVMVGGEAVSAKLLSTAVQGLGEGVLQNLYGPTETTIHVTRWICKDDGHSPVPIGRPIDETQAHVLDTALNRVPVGVAGELYISGELLARGYVGRPDLTAERFVANPFDEKGGRLYRTGDLVRWNEQGQLEYLGRVDDQIKIRGFRVELGEVQAQLLKQRGVREAVVVARETAQGTQLVGYVSGHGLADTAEAVVGAVAAAAADAAGARRAADIRDSVGTSSKPDATVAASAPTGPGAEGQDAALGVQVAGLDGAVLRASLKALLPDYMVPALIMVLERLPLNANGKIDRRALPAAVFDAGEGYEAPQGELEEQLAGIWAEVLGVERVGRQDNFFELGGHSLLALTLIERLRSAGIRAWVRELFDRPVLSGFAQGVREAQARAEAGEIGVGTEIEVPPNGIPAGCTSITPEMLPLVALTQAEIEAIGQQTPGGIANVQDIYPLAPLQEGMLFHHQLQQTGDAYVTPTLLAFDTRQRLEAFVASLNEVVGRHDILRTAVLWEGLSKPVQVVNRQARVVLEWPAISAAEADAPDRAGLMSDTETATGDSTVGDVRVQLEAHIDPMRYRIDVRRAPMIRLLGAEDAAHGRWLLQLASHHLISDHTTLERIVHEIGLLQQGKRAELPAVVPFRNFVAQAVLGRDAAAEAAFFGEMLGDVEETTAPFGIVDVQGDGSGVEEIRHPLPAELSAQIRQVARAQGVSAASVFHLAWAMVLSATSGQRAPVFGTVLFGRMGGVQGADQALGMFINTLPVRIEVGRQSAAQTLKVTHARLAALMQHEHASLAQVQRYSGVAAGAPLFTALLNYRYMTGDEAHAEDDSAWAGMSVLGGEERTNYPFDLSVDEMGDGFVLVPQVDVRIGAARIAGYVQQALQELVRCLITNDTRALSDLSVLSAAEQQELALLGRGRRGTSGAGASSIDEQAVLRAHAEGVPTSTVGAAVAASAADTTDSVASAGNAAIGVVDTAALAAGAIATVDLASAAATVGRGEREAPLLTFQRFEAHAAEQPDALALLFEGQRLSYGEVNVRANRLAHTLMARGVGVDCCVGIALERSPEMIIGVLAIQKAGGAWVPLDPALSAERLVHMMRDSGLRWVLTQAQLKDVLPQVAGVERLTIEALEASVREVGASDTHRGIDAGSAVKTGTCFDAGRDTCTGRDEGSKHTEEPTEVMGVSVEANPAVAIRGESLAYVIYTSGSTGAPKGVGISHTALAAHAEVAIGFFGLRPEDRMLQFSTMNFDGFIEQVFGPLAVGASIVIRGREIWDSQRFHEHLLADGISVVDLSTAYWSLLVQDFARQGVKDYGRLRQVHAGGEAMPPEAIVAWRRAGMGHIRLLNTYGPTEATVTAVVQDCAPYVSEALPLPAQMPIGEVLPGRQVYVLDGNLNRVPVGVAGELYIGGALLARGYVNRPDLTAERFIANPFVTEEEGEDVAAKERGPRGYATHVSGVPSSAPEAGSETVAGFGSRLYRTGDIVRWNERGQLEYLGRIDDQVKIRGFRVELGEVQAQLLKQQGVREAVVVARETAQGTQLVGYVSGHDSARSAGLDGAALRASLKALLPDYMVPSVIMVLPRLPLNANGKIDRRALPVALIDTTERYEAPEGELEEQLAGIWAEVLGVERVGRRDNFFELGGHSLLALTLVGRIQRSGLPVEASLVRLLKTQTVADYLEEEGKTEGIRLSGSADVSELAVMLNRCTVPEAVPLFMVHEGRGSVLDYVGLAQALADSCPVIGLQVGAAHVPSDMEQLARLHARTIQGVQPTGEIRVAGWSLGGALAPLIAQVLESAGRRVSWVGAIDPYIQALDREEIALVEFARAYVQSLVPADRAEDAFCDADVVTWLDGLRHRGENALHIEDVRAVTEHVSRLWGSESPDRPDARQRDKEGIEPGSQELSALFIASWKLHEASNVPCEGAKIHAPMHVWWAGEARSEHAGMFTGWMQSGSCSGIVLHEDHAGIIRSGSLFESIKSML